MSKPRYELKGSAIRDTVTGFCISLADMLRLANEHESMSNERKAIFDRLGDIEQRLDKIPEQIAILARSNGGNE